MVAFLLSRISFLFLSLLRIYFFLISPLRIHLKPNVLGPRTTAGRVHTHHLFSGLITVSQIQGSSWPFIQSCLVSDIRMFSGQGDLMLAIKVQFLFDDTVWLLGCFTQDNFGRNTIIDLSDQSRQVLCWYSRCMIGQVDRYIDFISLQSPI